MSIITRRIRQMRLADRAISELWFYDLGTKFGFGKFKGKTVKEVLEIQPSYLSWCAVNLDHFYISDYVIDKIKLIIPDFTISEEGQQKLSKKYKIWDYERRNKRLYYNYNDYDDEGCGGGSCSECDNSGCNAHPYN